MKDDQQRLSRFTPFERANHWLSAITFVLLALSGLSFFHPAFYPLSQLFGGGVWARILHPFLGVVMICSFGVMFLHYWRATAMTPADWRWLSRTGELLAGDERNMPEAGKFNGGQKLMFWLISACLTLLVLSGIVIWRAYFAYLFPVELIRFAVVVHAAAATLLMALIIVHIYAGIWVKESISGMVYGKVRRAWAKQHHLAWFRELTGGRK